MPLHVHVVRPNYTHQSVDSYLFPAFPAAVTSAGLAVSVEKWSYHRQQSFLCCCRDFSLQQLASSSSFFSISAAVPYLKSLEFWSPLSYPKSISISSSVFAGLTFVTNRQAHRSRYICNNRPHLMLAMRPNNNSNVWQTVSGQVKAHVILTCTNGVSSNHLPVVVASDRPCTTLWTHAH